ncbi:Flp pilus assembly protein CpaB [Novosphingobium sp. PS1R-30]|uniref:Flp pilus assembly protein CpaB n=1 Tax=Novosphingobium anseongense TaxID=3133436 RepID=A0ABU8RQF3_9SPHN|nr:MAG: Flp pilus assembly protein CpaB [Novosphingobium sp.]
MDKKKLTLLLVALVIAVGTALAARSLFVGASAPQAEAAAPEATGPKVLVAQRALPVGTIITADSVSFQAWPKEMVQDAYFIDGEADMSKLLGTVVRNPITAGQPITQGTLVAPGDRGFLAAALGPGMRAITIPVSVKTGVAGFIFPGDHVDLVLTQSVKGTDSQPLKASETILKNLRVLATDQATSTETVDGKSVVRTSSTVTLEVTPRIAEKVAVAETIGQLSLSLRSLADNQSELDRAIASGSVKVPEGASKEQEDKILSLAMNRPVEGPTTYQTGGDVSRFQRASMPSQAPRPVAAPGPAVTVNIAPVGPRVRVMRGKAAVQVVDANTLAAAPVGTN